MSLIKLVSRQSYRDYTTNLTHITLWTHRSFKRSEETKGIERTVRPKCNVRLVVLKGRLLSVVYYNRIRDRDHEFDRPFPSGHLDTADLSNS